MKKTILTAIVCMSMAAPLLADGTNNILTDEKSKVSYAIGLSYGSSLKMHGVEVDDSLFLKGFQDAMSGGNPLLTQLEVHQILSEYQKTLMAKQQALQAERGLKAKTEGEAFLATNKNNPGVITLPDGLQYQVLKAGTGPIPSAASTVTANYSGKFVSGEEFDSSAKQGHPGQFPVTGVIHGWTEALQLMPVGSKWRLFVPSDLAYGPQGRPPVIPPNCTLVFDIELLNSETPPPRQTSLPPPAVQSPPLTSDIIKVPSAAERAKGAQIERINPADLQKLQNEAASSTNAPAH